MNDCQIRGCRNLEWKCSDCGRVANTAIFPMMFAQVIEGLKEGKSFMRKAWNCDARRGKPIHMGYSKSYIWDSDQNKAGFTMEDFEATDWVEVK